VISTAFAGEVIYRASFELGPFVLGDLNDQAGWSVVSGSAAVQSGVCAVGDWSVMATDARCVVSLTSMASVVWVDGWHRDTGSGSQPMINEELMSGVLFFSATRGLLALDGDGMGNGVFVTVDASFSSDQFVRVTMRMDYTHARYDVWVNGKLKRANLGFKNREVTALSEIWRESDGVAYLDDLVVSTWGMDEDRDGDGIVDLEEINGMHGAWTDPENPDSDRDGVSDGDEILMGTDPMDGSSRFEPKYRMQTSGGMEFQIDVRAGRYYTMQRNSTLRSDTWEDVPGAINLTGADGEVLLMQAPASTEGRQFYRISIKTSL